MGKSHGYGRDLRSPATKTQDFLADLVDELRFADRHALATSLERCFRYGSPGVAARDAIKLIAEDCPRHDQ